MLAHLMNSGLGPYYDGLLHFVATPEDLLPVIAISLLAGLRGPLHGRIALFALPLSWLAGTALGHAFGLLGFLPLAAAVLTIVLGGLVAADRTLSPATVGVLAILLGLVHGAGNGAELGAVHAGAVGSALGVATAIFVVVALLAALVSSVRAPAARIVVRVAGSWIAAAALLILGWSLRSAQDSVRAPRPSDQRPIPVDQPVR